MIEPEDKRPVQYLGGPIRQFIMRYPYWIAGALGMIYITASRPCTRYIPEPPPILGQVNPPTLTPVMGGEAPKHTLSGRVWIAGHVCVSCEGPQAQLRQALETLAPKLDRLSDQPIGLLAMMIASEDDSVVSAQQAWAKRVQGDSQRWLVGHASGDELRRWAVELKPHFTDHRGQYWTRLVLIDDRGQLRGAYNHGELGIDEVYHRAQHVVRQSREIAREKSH